MIKLTKLLLYILILSFCLGQFGRLPGLGGGVRLYLWDIVAALLVFLWLFWRLGVEKSLELPPLWFPIAAFSLWSLICLLNGKRWIGMGEWAVAAAYWGRWVIYAGVYFVVSDLVRIVSGLRSQIANVLVFSGIVLALLGFAQLLVFPNLSDLDPALGWDPHQGRLVSTWLDPNFLGAYFVLCLSLLTGRFLDSRRNSTTPRVLLAISYLLLGAALILTFSRSAWGMLAVVIGVFGLFKSRKLLLLMVGLFFGAYFLVPRVQTRLAGVTDPADSASLRLVSWQQTFKIIKEYPLLGVGFNAFRYAQERQGFFRSERGVPLGREHSGAGSDSSLLLVWATTGVVGLLIYLWLYGRVAWGAWQEHNRNALLALPLLAGLVGLFLEASFVNSLFYSPIVLWLWIVVGLVVGVE